MLAGVSYVALALALAARATQMAIRAEAQLPGVSWAVKWVAGPT